MQDSPKTGDTGSRPQSAAAAVFVSDVHLHSALPRTTDAFLQFLDRHALESRQLYLLGDLFEYWAGDDDMSSPYVSGIVSALRRVSDAGVEVFWIAGNRDFLVGSGFAAATGARLLEDPAVVSIAGHRIALAHGDAQCTGDVSYMAFRAQVRDPAWQRQFLAQPLAQRKAIIEGLRAGSRAAQQEKSVAIMDVSEDAIAGLFDMTGASILIHGHTHRPRLHEYPQDGRMRRRFVLPDWDCDADQPRGGWIAVDTSGNIRECPLAAL